MKKLTLRKQQIARLTEEQLQGQKGGYGEVDFGIKDRLTIGCVQSVGCGGPRNIERDG